MCSVSKNLYNQALYEVRQSLASQNKFLFYGDMNRIMMTKENLEGNINYKLLKAQVSQQCLRLLDKNIKSYIKSVKDWSRNRKKYRGKPKLPSYKKKYNLLVYPNQSSSISDGFLNLARDMSIRIPQYEKYGERLKKYQQTRIIPMKDGVKVEIIYDADIDNSVSLSKDKYASVDLGVDNLATVVFDEGDAVIYNGKTVKSVNQFANKLVSKYKSELEAKNKKKTSKRICSIWEKRNRRMDDMFHKISRDIVRKALKDRIGTIIVGYNSGWKDSIQIGRRNNQIFVNIPFKSLISKLRYKCEMCGITFITNEESYTSKCDSLALEDIGQHDEYLGKRVKRGLYQSSCGKLLNADVNGALNIMRKVVGDSEMSRIIDSGRLFRPTKYNIL
jgi:putative transposase